MVISNSNLSTNDQLRKKFKELAKEAHPDLHPNDANATAKFQNLQQAFDKLKVNPKKYSIHITISLYDAIAGCQRYFVSLDGKRKYMLKIPAGVKPNEVIAYRDIQIVENRFDNLDIKINIDYPDNYSYKNGKLIYNLKIPIWKIYWGGTHIIEAVDGARLKLKIPSRTKSGSIFEIYNEGLYSRTQNKRESLFIQVKSSFLP